MGNARLTGESTFLKYLKGTIVSLFVFAWAITISTPATAESTLTLQKKCDEGANSFVVKLESVAAYNFHYSKKLDGCFLRAGFYLGAVNADIKLADGKIMSLKHPHTMQGLYNVFEGKMIGNFELIGTTVQNCWIANTKCESVEEFENLSKPYLEH